MLRRIFIGLAVLILVGLGIGYIFRFEIGFAVLKGAMKPPAAFADTVPPAQPDYADTDHWAALPDRPDEADAVPDGVQDGQATAGVDVFFIHPTTYLENSGWNAPMDDAESRRLVDEFVMRGQASAYNGAARVFAPRYRQAQFYSFLALDEGGNDALALAYTDVEAAFDYYLTHYNEGRPFIIAAHSQGALHTRTLLERRISGTPLMRQFIAAYPVGYYFAQSELAVSLPDIPVCATPTQTRCLVTWNATGDGYREPFPLDDMICVNPLSWTAGEDAAAFDDNLGAFLSADQTIHAGVADGRCTGGRLYISEIRTDIYDDLPATLGPGNHHLLDYALYWSNIRANVADRVNAYMQ